MKYKGENNGPISSEGNFRSSDGGGAFSAGGGGNFHLANRSEPFGGTVYGAPSGHIHGARSVHQSEWHGSVRRQRHQHAFGRRNDWYGFGGHALGGSMHS